MEKDNYQIIIESKYSPEDNNENEENYGAPVEAPPIPTQIVITPQPYIPPPIAMQGGVFISQNPLIIQGIPQHGAPIVPHPNGTPVAPYPIPMQQIRRHPEVNNNIQREEEEEEEEKKKDGDLQECCATTFKIICYIICVFMTFGLALGINATRSN